MDNDDKLDIILKKLQETENKVKELEKKNEEQEKIIQKEEKSVQQLSIESKGTPLMKNKMVILAVIAVIAVVLIVLFAFKLPPFSYSAVQTNSTSSQFFDPLDGSILGSNYVTGLSNVSAQLAAVGLNQANSSLSSSFISNIKAQGFTRKGNSSIFCLNAAPTTSSGQGHPAYCLLFMSDGNYNVIPIMINNSFPTLSAGGKPTFLYIGASGCPFCAAMRWSLVIALSRFGNFSKLFYDRSATIDGNVPTVMFNFSQAAYDSVISKPTVRGGPYGDTYPTPFVEGAYYSSQYINFEPIDQLGTSFLTNSTGIENILGSNFKVPAASGFNILDMPDFPYYGVPFFDINNRFVFDGAIVDISPLFSPSGSLSPQYSTHADILNSIQNPSSNSFGETALGAANILTAQICDTINNSAPVCSLSYIKNIGSLVNGI